MLKKKSRYNHELTLFKILKEMKGKMGATLADKILKRK